MQSGLILDYAAEPLKADPEVVKIGETHDGHAPAFAATSHFT